MEQSEKIRIDTLAGLKRSHDCGNLREGDVGQEAVLMGWVNTRRDLGNLIFIDLRDRGGMTQVVFDPGIDSESHRRAGILRNEWVIAVKGKVSHRLEGQENPGMPTGDIELKVEELRILNITEPPPFQVDGAVDASETLRLKHRYLELRRPQAYKVFHKRHLIASCIREFLNNKDFIEVETPFLTKSTPEGARDYLVPSRVSRGLFYALPQSPQLFKQLLMIAGFDRYYQIVRCFRDEDLRADRQPEFTQIDVEMAFVDEDDVMGLFEEMIIVLFRGIMCYEISSPIERIKYSEAMERFGTDRPDIRFKMELLDMSHIAGRSDFKVFKNVIDGGGVVKAINVGGGAPLFSRKDLDEFATVVQMNGAKGLAWIRVKEEGWQSSLDKFFNDDEKKSLQKKAEAQPGDLILIVADKAKIANQALGTLRLDVARRLDLLDDKNFSFVWVTEFPLFEYDEKDKRLQAVHHPFTAPFEKDIPVLEDNPELVRARSYDLVLNGAEIGGGSIRIHDPYVQESIFKILRITQMEAEAKFGFLLNALKHGAPPHGGMAIGFDRLVAIMAGLKSIREVIAFPKTTSAGCPLTGAPSAIDPEKIEELGLRIKVE